MDFATLRQEGIKELERLSGGEWTDYNLHDPGITLLEQVCYGLTDLFYRNGHDLPDLLAEGGADPYASLHSPAAILTTRPVTLADLRRLALDTLGVRNAWVEPVTETDFPLYYHPDRDELTLIAAPPPSEPVHLKGLYRVLLETEEGAPGDTASHVARRLHQNRGLCEDFDRIAVLDPQLIRITANIEIGLVDDVAAVGRDIEQRIADAISPPVPFATLDDMIQSGRSPAEIFNGPRLTRGFLTDEALQRATRRTAIHASDLVHAITDSPAVRAIGYLRIASGGRDERWSLTIDAGRVARLDRAGSRIMLLRAGKVIARAGGQAAPPALALAAPGREDIAPPPGRDRRVQQYRSVQDHLPAIYGVGELGLPSSAPPERRARARQLQAYLWFFDQLMANHLAQLAHVKDLFSYDGDETRTYFTQSLAQPGLGLEQIRIAEKEQEVLTAAERGPASLERKSRFLNHLLALFGEALEDGAGTSPEALLRNKQSFLRDHPERSGGRGTGADALEPAGPGNRAGVDERVRLRLGLSEADGETFLLVEHILLRPMEGDDGQQIPLLATPLHEDPYSLQLTFVLPYGAGRFPRGDDDAERRPFRDLLEQTIREETPAHLTPYLKWATAAELATFKAAYLQWLDRRRLYIADRLNIPSEERRP